LLNNREVVSAALKQYDRVMARAALQIEMDGAMPVHPVYGLKEEIIDEIPSLVRLWHFWAKFGAFVTIFGSKLQNLFAYPAIMHKIGWRRICPSHEPGKMYR
jgi:hypothetical protein